MSEPALLPLADDFGPADEAAWMRLVEKTLKGEPLETLRTRTADDIVIEPLYRDGPASPVRPAFSSDPARPWDLRALVTPGNSSRANGQVLEELENGAASVLLRVGPEHLEQALAGVVLDLAPVALDLGFAARDGAERLASLAKGGPQAQLFFHFDPLGALAVSGASPGPVETQVVESARLGARLAEPYPKARLFLASGRVVHEAGGSEGQELGFALACALYYARSLVDEGLEMREAFGRLALGLSADATYFTTIAKLRAARLLWAKLTAACEAETPAYIEARSSRRMLARLDAWTNMLRLTAAGFGAGVGGADAVVLEPFTAPLGPPTAFARRQARNAQLVLMEEANLGRVSDPAGGAWFLESLTDQLARAGWAAFQSIEAQGGAVAALAAGGFENEVAIARDARQADYREGRANLIGVTRFPDAGAAPPETEPQDAASDEAWVSGGRLPGPDTTVSAMQPMRWSEPFEQEETGDGR